MTEQRQNKKNANSEVRTFSVPFALNKIKENITINTNTPTKPSKEKLIKQALKFHSQGNISEAEKYYKSFINHGYKDHRVFSNYGILLQADGKLKEAELLTREATLLRPDFADSHNNLGGILRDLGKLKEAELSIKRAITLKPNLSEAYYNLSNILIGLKKPKEAEIATRKAIEIKPNFAEAYNNLGIILNSFGNLKDAEIAHRKAIKHKPSYAEAYSNLGGILKNLNNLKEAESLTRKAIKLKPNYADAYYNLGCILSAAGKLKEAEICHRKAIEIKPSFVEAHNNLGNTLGDLNKLEEAQKSYKRCLDLKPNDNQYLSNLIQILLKFCDWDEIDSYSPLIKQIGLEGRAINPLDLMYLEDNPEKNLKRAINYSKKKEREELPNLHKRKGNDKIKLGYFSSDFRNHPVSISLISILELHNKSKFKVYIYSLSKSKDYYTERIKDTAFCFREITDLSDIEIVNLVRNDQIDIAIDLNGHTKFNRLSIFSYRLAPFQINYLGYPGTIGSKSFDYIIADKILIPEDNKKFYTEKVLYLQNTLLPPLKNKKLILKNKFSREELGLPVDAFVFTCFNNIQKITRRELNIWIRLLMKIDKSVLWLAKPHESAINNILTEMTKYGIEKDRVIFAKRMNLEDHSCRHCCGDLFLDTFNYNAGATANIALSFGLPIITLAGKSYSARMAASILSAYDLNELITDNESSYENLAYELAINNKKLNDIRKKIRNNFDCSFFDANKYTQDLELIYTNILIEENNIIRK
ncbi:tetratricopeptide repeat protein [Prochlorococcus sp. MIT 0916]|uniref:O-linked N-acetylglucosamine transferase family protein n=1 Tax=Prochlorococcus sp. MIT 0916 TaxID=3082521 RepID=UPI0039B65468